MSQIPDQTIAPLYDNMRKLINIIDELKDVGVHQYIRLPKIVVVGSQSAGKSSLLESIVGIDFLPRGEGVVTRRPLELRLVHVSLSPDGVEEFRPYAEFSQEPKVKYFDFNQVREKIIHYTDQVAGRNCGIVDNPITMTVYSTTCPDLTLVDLPGITRIPLKGTDQTHEIEKITKNMCRRYARDPRTIILAVSPANQDLSTSDALQLAQQEDPEGLRTIGVLTKIDIMDNGSDARKMLMGTDISLKLGFVGVKGRSQHDIKMKMKVADALKAEKEFFASHPIYSALSPGYVGTEALTQKLTKVLFSHIKATLPEIFKEIQLKVSECEERMKELGNPLPSTPHEKMQLLWNMVTDFTENFKNNQKGRYDPRRNTRITGEMSGGARIKMMFQELYSGFSDKKATEGISNEQIRKAMLLQQGDSIPGFPSVDSFLFLISPLLKQLKDPALELLNNVHLYLENISSQLISKIFRRFPSIIDEINDIVNEALKQEKDLAQEFVENMIEAEKIYIFTNDLEFMTQRTSFVPKTPPKSNVSTQSEGTYLDPMVEEMRARIDAYFSIVVRNIRDTIPKIIGNFLVKAIQEKLQFTLYDKINKNETLMMQIGEPPHIIAERETLSKIIDTLKKAKLILTKDPDFALTFKEASSNLFPKASQSSPSTGNPSQKSTDLIKTSTKVPGADRLTKVEANSQMLLGTKSTYQQPSLMSSTENVSNTTPTVTQSSGQNTFVSGASSSRNNPWNFVNQQDSGLRKHNSPSDYKKPPSAGTGGTGLYG